MKSKSKSQGLNLNVASAIFLKLVLFYILLIATGLCENPFSVDAGMSWALYSLLAAAYSLIDAQFWGFPQPSSAASEPGQPAGNR